MSTNDDIGELKQRVASLEHDLGIQQDIHAIRRLQYAYGYFIDKSLYNEIVDLFADDVDVWFLGGIYENRYVREDGIWKISRLGYFPFWHGSFADGWAKTPIDFIPKAKTCYPEDPVGPDELIDPALRLWPATDIIPFHNDHPVTGKPIEIDKSRAREGFADEH
jgi:hypothetical protein